MISPYFREPRAGEVRRIYLPGTWVNRLVGQLLQGPAVPVRIAEGSVQDAPKVLYFVDPNSSLDELHTRGVYVRDDQVQTLDRARRCVYDPDPEGDRASRPRGS